jgi:hypothetical protein
VDQPTWARAMLAGELQEKGHDVRSTTSANMPWVLDGVPMSNDQFHGTAHAMVFPRSGKRAAPKPTESED